MDRSEEFKKKLKELKLMLIERILKNRSDDDWEEYKGRNAEEWIERESMLILLTEELVDLMVDKCEADVRRIFAGFLSLSSVTSRAVQCSLVKLCTSVSDRVGQGRYWWKGHRVVCWVVGWMVEKCGDGWIDETIDCVVDYLVKLLESEDLDIVMQTILTSERLWFKMKTQLGNERRNRLRTALIRHSAPTDTGSLEGALDLDSVDVKKYQVDWCARWSVDNLRERWAWEPLLNMVKMSSDGFEARCDLNSASSPIRSLFSAKSNVYFYEVICVTNGELQLGWSTRESRISKFNRIGHNEHSVILHVGDELYIRHNNRRHQISTPTPFRQLNSVGCLFDLKNGHFEFYINGRALVCPFPAHLSPQPYFATALLTPHQHCHFNFGQSPFKFPPRNIRFTTFDEQSGGDGRKYRLVDGEWHECGYWFKHTTIDNQVSLFFCDKKQNEFDEVVKKVLRDIENFQIRELFFGDRNYYCYWEKGWSVIRYIQSIIEVMGKVNRVGRVDVMAMWVGQVIENTINQVYIEKLLELLYPYLHLVPTQSTLAQHRSICIILQHLIKPNRHHLYKFIKQIRHDVITYLNRIFTCASDQWTQLFVLIALRDLKMNEAEKREIKSCGQFEQMVDKWSHKFAGENIEEILNSESGDTIEYHLYLSYYNFFTSIYLSFPNHITNSTTNSTIDPHDFTPNLSNSPCNKFADIYLGQQSFRPHVSKGDNNFGQAPLNFLFPRSRPFKRPRINMSSKSVPFVSESRPEKNLRSNNFKITNIETSLSSIIPLSISPSFTSTNDESVQNNQSNNYNNQATQSSPTVISNEPIRLTHKWVIENFKSFFKKGSKPLSVMYSDPFPVSNLLSNKVQFSLRLVPSFKEDTKNAYVSLFLYLEHCVLDAISVKYKITIINADSIASLIEDNGNKIQIFRPEQFWGNEKFVALNKLLNESNGFLADGKLTISCQVETAGHETNEMDNLQFKIISSPESLFDCNVKVARFNYIWKVKKFGALFYHTNKLDNLFEAQTSPKFWSKNRQNNNQTEYYLSLWPKGVDELNKDFVALHLFLESQTKQQLTVHYRLSILNWKNEIHHSGEGRFEKIQPLLTDSNKPKNESAKITLDKGSSRYISRKDVLNLDNGLLPEDTLTLCCEIEEITKL